MFKKCNQPSGTGCLVVCCVEVVHQEGNGSECMGLGIMGGGKRNLL